VVRVKPLMQALLADEMPAVALTDQSNLFAMVKFTRAALGAGIKPLIGVDALVRYGDDQEAPFQMVLLAQRLPQSFPAYFPQLSRRPAPWRAHYSGGMDRGTS